MKIYPFILLCFLYPYSGYCDDDTDITVNSLPFDASLYSLVKPVSVLSHEDLMTKRSGTLGELLNGEPGVSSSSFGPGAGRPIIRGLDGSRVKILQNGIGTLDVSDSSPDHFVSVSPREADKIEILRGPETLLYGTNAVGGVVNIIDERIPESLPSSEMKGDIDLLGDTATKTRSEGISLQSAIDSFVVHFNTQFSKSSDIDIPGFARTKEKRDEPLEFPEPRGVLPFSSTQMESVTVGGAYINPQGFFGGSIGTISSDYGVPNGEKNIKIEGVNDRVDFKGKVFDPIEGLNSAQFKIGVVDYEHTEFEDGEAGTVFKNRGFDSRYELEHDPISGFKGVLGLQLEKGDFSALGEEAFQPPTETKKSSTFAFEKYRLSEFLELHFGGRFEHEQLRADFDESSNNMPSDRTFSTWSDSAGIVYEINDPYSIGLTFSQTERPPTAQEVFSDGPHVATASYELGDYFLSPENSTGIDLTVKKDKGTVQGTLNLFLNKFDNFIALIPTNTFEQDLPVYAFTHVDAQFVGFESKLSYLLSEGVGVLRSFDVVVDYTRGVATATHDSLPRMPPLRTTVGFNYDKSSIFDSRIELQQVFHQGEVAKYEVETPGYTLLNAMVGFPISSSLNNFEIFIKGSNLLGEKVREHTSFIKDIAPLPGASLSIGVQCTF